MKKLVLAALLPAAVLSAAAPASAQGWGHHNNNNGWRTPARNADIRQDINNLRWQIDRAQQRRTISWREADYLRSEVGKIQRQYAQFARGGLDRYEHAALERRVGFVHQKLRAERWDRDGRRG